MKIKVLAVVALITSMVGFSGCVTPLKHLYKTTEAAMDRGLRKTFVRVKPPRLEKKTSSVWVFKDDGILDPICSEFFLTDSVVKTKLPGWTYTKQTTTKLDAGIEVLEHTADPNSQNQKEELDSGKAKIKVKITGLKIKPELSIAFTGQVLELFPLESIFDNVDRNKINVSETCKSSLDNAANSKDFAENAVIVIRTFNVKGLEYSFDNMLEFGFEADLNLKKLLFDSNGSVTSTRTEAVEIKVPAQTHFWSSYFCTFWRPSEPPDVRSNKYCEKSIDKGGKLPKGTTPRPLGFISVDDTYFGDPVERSRIRKAIKLENSGTD